MSLIEKLFPGRAGSRNAEKLAIEFKPCNDLENALVQAQARTLPVADFFSHLIASKVALLLDKEIPESGAWDNSIAPLVLVSPRGGNVLAVFTSVERATPTAQNSKEHKYALLTDFSWVLKGVAPGVGIVVNPGWPVGVEIEPARVAELKNA